MGKYSKIINSFKLRDTLNPKVWDNFSDAKNARMIPEIREALLKIGEEFIDYLGEDIFVEDIVLTGSLANYNWSEFSDFDLHVHVNMEEYKEEAELRKEIFELKKVIFNQKHNIKVKGYDVELYAQDIEEVHISSAQYSIMNDEWIQMPKKNGFKLDEITLKEKIKCWVDKIDRAIDTDSDEDDIEVLESLRKKLKTYRQSGLESEGEMSYENLVFKFLRRSGYIQKLFDSKNQAIDKKLSVETEIQD